jgi:hypothetical protein
MNMKQVVRCVNDTLMADVGIQCTNASIERAVREDCANVAGTYPSKREIELLIMGDDEGNIPETVVCRFPNLSALISEQF